MILTGREITKEIDAGNIHIQPFTQEQVNPNSYNYRLGDTLKVFRHMVGNKPIFEEIIIQENGYILEPGQLYLASTKEVLGSKKYAMSLIGRSSIGRLGLFLQISANLGHTTSEHQWTLELVAAKKIRIYPGMIIGQITFWENKGEFDAYQGLYGTISAVQESLMY